MFKYLLLLLFFFKNYLVSSQNLDTISSNILIKFNKVKHSVKEASIAQMEVRFVRKDRMALINFDVPSFLYRSGTTLSDFCIINSRDKKIKLQNQIEVGAKGNNKNWYSFSFIFSMDSLKQILQTKIKNLIFNFSPNNNIEKDFLATGNKLERFDKYLIKISRKTLKIKVSKPDLNKISELINWIDGQK